MTLEIDYKIVNDNCFGGSDLDDVDVAASLSKLAEQTATVLKKAYPEAKIDVTTGSSAMRCKASVFDSDNPEANQESIEESVEQVSAAVWERGEWYAEKAPKSKP